MFVFGVEVRLAVFCLKQHFETDRDRFKTSNLSYFQNSNVRRIIGLRVSQHIGAFVFTVFYSKSKYTEQQSVCTRLKAEAGTPWISTLHHLTCFLEQVQFFSAFTWRGEGITANWQFRLMAVSGELLDMGGERGATFFQVFWSPLLFGKFFPFTETYKVKCKYLAFTLAFTPCKLWQLTLDSTRDGIIWYCF